MRTILSLLMSVAVVGLTVFYLYRAVLKRLRFFFGKGKAAAVILTILLLAPVAIVNSVWPVVLLYLLMTLLAGDLLAWIVRKALRNASAPVWLKRIHYSGILIVLATALIMGYGSSNMFHIVETDYTLTTTKNIREEGYKIVLFTDLHYGTTLSDAQLQTQCEQISAQAADIVVLGGDIVDERTTYEQMRYAMQALGKIESRFGIYYVYGNHDKNNYARDPQYTAEQLADAAAAAGITLLEDEAVTVNQEILLAGRADYSDMQGSRASIAALLENEDAGKEIIVIDHQPRAYDEAKAQGVDMLLSGHTHAGQVWPGGVLAEIFPFDEMVYGCARDGEMYKIVSSGMAGWGYPIRTERHSEYVVIELVRE